MVQRKWLGDKTKGGFYKKAKGGDGKEDERLALDWKTLEYHPRQKPKFAALDMAKNTVEDTGARIRTLLGVPDGAGLREERQGRSVPVVGIVGLMELLCQPRARNLRFDC